MAFDEAAKMASDFDLGMEILRKGVRKCEQRGIHPRAVVGVLIVMLAQFGADEDDLRVGMAAAGRDLDKIRAGGVQ